VKLRALRGKKFFGEPGKIKLTKRLTLAAADSFCVAKNILAKRLTLAAANPFCAQQKTS
jgi:hypothetical protein